MSLAFHGLGFCIHAVRCTRDRGSRSHKEIDMKTVLRFALVVFTIGAALGMIGCNDISSRNTLTVVSVNDGNTYYSDLLNEADSAKVFIPVDNIAVTFGNIPNSGGDPLAAGTPYSEIVLTSYAVTYDNGIFSPISGGMNLRVASGGTITGTISISNSSEKAALLGTLMATSTTTARIHFTGYNHINGPNNGDRVEADAALAVQVDNFGDSDVNQ